MISKLKISTFTITVFFIMVLSIHAEELKGIQLESKDDTTVSYILPQSCMVRLNQRMHEGPLIQLGEWLYRGTGEHTETGILQLPYEIELEAYTIDGLIADTDTVDFEKEQLLQYSGIDPDLDVSIQIISPRLGQYIHDYQKHIHKIRINVKNIEQHIDNRYTMRYAIDAMCYAPIKNIPMPYVMDIDFSIYGKGLHTMYIEVRGGKRSIGTGVLHVMVE